MPQLDQGVEGEEGMMRMTKMRAVEVMMEEVCGRRECPGKKACYQRG